ncbi:MAG: DnaB-like helicase C-terminal domain-containing protein [Candidatus Aenigmatarchaeota archaeon]
MTSFNIEKQFLKKILLEKGYIDIVLSKGINPSYFLEFTYNWVAQVLFWYYERYKTLPQKQELMEIVHQSVKLSDHQKQLVLIALEEIFTPDNTKFEFSFLLDTFLNYYKEASLKTLLFTASTLVREGKVDKALNKIQEELINIQNKVTFRSEEVDVIKTVDERLNRYNSREVNLSNGVYIGFPTLDKITYGLRGGWVTIVLGANKSGKSTFLLNAAVNSYLNGYNVVLISLEIPKDQMVIRWDACRTEIEYDKLLRNTLSDVEIERINRLLKEDKERKNTFYIVDAVNFSAHSLYGLLKRLPFKVDLVVIDYLGLMKPIGGLKNEKVWESFAKIGLEVREVARELNVPILSAMQVNREAYKSDSDLYGVEDIALSFLVTCHVDLVLSLKINDRKSLYEGLPVDINAAIVASRVSRNGSFNILADFGKMKMKEIIREEINEPTKFNF